MTTPHSNPPGHQDAHAPRPYLTCRQVIDFIMSYLDGELKSEQHLEFERHLGVCPSCVNYLDSYRQTIQIGQAALADSDEPASGVFPEALLRAIREARLRRG